MIVAFYSFFTLTRTMNYDDIHGISYDVLEAFTTSLGAMLVTSMRSLISEIRWGGGLDRPRLGKLEFALCLDDCELRDLPFFGGICDLGKWSGR